MITLLEFLAAPRALVYRRRRPIRSKNLLVRSASSRLPGWLAGGLSCGVTHVHAGSGVVTDTDSVAAAADCDKRIAALLPTGAACAGPLEGAGTGFDGAMKPARS